MSLPVAGWHRPNKHREDSKAAQYDSTKTQAGHVYQTCEYAASEARRWPTIYMTLPYFRIV